MAETRGSSDDSEDVTGKPILPAESIGDSLAGQSPMLDYRSAPSPEKPAAEVIPYFSVTTPSEESLVTLRRMDAMEAQMALAKLESEGIRCYIAGQVLSATHPLLFSDVRLQVVEADALRAEEILRRPPADDLEGEYADENWRCPKCHRKVVDLVPLSKTLSRLRVLWVFLLVAPILRYGVDWLFSTTQMSRLTERYWPLWLIITAALSLLMFNLKRRQRCRDCGFEWTHGEAAKEMEKSSKSDDSTK